MLSRPLITIGPRVRKSPFFDARLKKLVVKFAGLQPA